MTQGLAVPVGRETPIWFGPLKQKFKGFPDLFGFEVFRTEISGPFNTVLGIRDTPVFTVVEVKTKNDRVKPAQRRYLDWAVTQGIGAYVAIEDDSEAGYELKEWGK